jgi:Aspartyl protease
VDSLRLPILSLVAVFGAALPLPAQARCQIGNVAPAELPYWAKTYSIADLSASPRDAQAIRVNVVLNGHAVRALIDSGSSVSLLTKSVADSLGVHYLSSNAEVVGIGRHSLPTWIVDVQSFKLGDESINNTQLRVAQLGKYQTMERIGSRIPVDAGTASSIPAADRRRSWARSASSYFGRATAPYRDRHT